MCSAFTRLPLHHSVNSRKSGAGKTHDLTKTANYFPKKYVIAMVGMSDKALFHRRGTFVIVDDETGNTIPIKPLIDDIKSKIDKLESELDSNSKSANSDNKDTDKTKKKEIKEKIEKLKDEIQEINEKSQKLIELNNKIFLFLDTAQEGLFNTLMSMISQDTSDDQLYEFTDKNAGSGKLGSKVNRLRGTPTIFNTQVIDDTRQVRYEEKNRRLIHVIPDTSSEKIHAAMDQITKRYGLLPEEYSEQVVSTADKDRAKDIVGILVEKLIDHTKPLAPKESGVKIPFAASIHHGIHRDKDTTEWAMTVADRTMRYLTIITKVNMDSRPRVVDTQTGKFYPVATFRDLKETLQLMGMASSMLRPYVAKWYNEVFLPAFKALPDQPRGITKEITNNRGETEEVTIMRENEIGLTSKELAVKTTEIMKQPASADSIRKHYIYPLLNMGIINSSKSVINKSENLYSPVEDSIFSIFDSDNDSDLRLKITDTSFYPDRYPSKNVLHSPKMGDLIYRLIPA